jgi:hypothetical protein
MVPLASWRAQDNSNGVVNAAVEQVHAQSRRPFARQPHGSSESVNHAFAGSATELRPFEEIDRAAGIKGPRLGYRIGKVIETLSNEHIRNLPTDQARVDFDVARCCRGSGG